MSTHSACLHFEITYLVWCDANRHFIEYAPALIRRRCSPVRVRVRAACVGSAEKVAQIVIAYSHLNCFNFVARSSYNLFILLRRANIEHTLNKYWIKIRFANEYAIVFYTLGSAKVIFCSFFFFSSAHTHRHTRDATWSRWTVPVARETLAKKFPRILFLTSAECSFLPLKMRRICEDWRCTET